MYHPCMFPLYTRSRLKEVWACIGGANTYSERAIKVSRLHGGREGKQASVHERITESSSEKTKHRSERIKRRHLQCRRNVGSGRSLAQGQLCRRSALPDNERKAVERTLFLALGIVST